MDDAPSEPMAPPFSPFYAQMQGNSVSFDHDIKPALFSPNSPPPSAVLDISTNDVKAEEDMKRPALSHTLSASDVVTRRSANNRKKQAVPLKYVLIDDLPAAWDEAHETFESLERCVYERKDMGLSREQDEMMVCDCVYDKHDPDAEPCGSQSDCINRAIFIECLADECRARNQCRNQRFMKRQYAPLEIVLTPMKGYGLRAADSIPSGSLIYEYIGEVIQERTFRKRMQIYADEGIRHFYFMMLQKEEYIDATKKGGIGRFANHSCNPNSEVQKWVVGRRLRMGIFSKREIVKGEEVTFNYNVDRYGHDAQPCYCGEPNCVGTIGGKTQTDVGTMNDLFLDALGIMDEVEALEMKGSKKKRSRQLDKDFVPILRPILEPEVQKVAAAMRQSMENVKMMSRLLQRINMTEDAYIHRQLMRMHGFSLMSMILTELSAEREIVVLVLESMSKWKLQIRNKIEDSKIEEPVSVLRNSPDETIADMAKQLIDFWSTLELSYKIPRVPKMDNLDAQDEAATTTIAEANSWPSGTRRPQAWENDTQIHLDLAPVRYRPLLAPRPRPTIPPPQIPERSSVSFTSDRLKLDAILALAQQTVASAAAVPQPSESPAAESSGSGSRTLDDDRSREEEERRKRNKRAHHAEEDVARKEKRLTKLIGDEVVRSMSKYKEQMEHDTFKRYAKECTMTLVEKEKRGHSYSTTRYPSLTDDKKAKVKAFTKEYAHKLLKRLKDKGKLRKPQSKTSSSTPSATPATTSTSTDLVETPNGSINGHLDLVSEMFGEDDPDDARGEDGMEEMGMIDPFSPNFRIPDHSALATLRQSSLLEKKVNGGIRIESLVMGTPTRTPTSAGSGEGSS